MQKNLGCFELFTGKAECDRHHFGVVARLEEGSWSCCDRPALRYRWVYSVHGLKTLHIGYPTDTRTGSWEMQQVKIAENCRSPSLLPVLLSPASYLMPPLRENINTTLMHLQRHTVRLPRRVQQGTPVITPLLHPGSSAFSCLSNIPFASNRAAPSPLLPRVSLGLKAETWPINTTAGSSNLGGGGGERRDRERELTSLHSDLHTLPHS